MHKLINNRGVFLFYRHHKNYICEFFGFYDGSKIVIALNRKGLFQALRKYNQN